MFGLGGMATKWAGHAFFCGVYFFLQINRPPNFCTQKRGTLWRRAAPFTHQGGRPRCPLRCLRKTHPKRGRSAAQDDVPTEKMDIAAFCKFGHRAPLSCHHLFRRAWPVLRACLRLEVAGPRVWALYIYNQHIAYPTHPVPHLNPTPANYA
jgi:hypothetical protein